MFINKIFCKILKKRNKNLEKLMKRGNKLLDEELDIFRIIKSIRILKNEEESKFVID